MDDIAAIGGQLLPLIRARRTTAPVGRECEECDTVLSIYNMSTRCSLHRTARSADRALLRCADDLTGD